MLVAQVGDKACSGVEACLESEGSVADESCRGREACQKQKGHVDQDSWCVSYFLLYAASSILYRVILTFAPS